MVKRAINEALDRDNGHALLLPALAKAYGAPIDPRRIMGDVQVWKFQEGSDLGVYKVSVTYRPVGQPAREIAFCLNAAKSAEADAKLRSIHYDLRKMQEINPEYVVEPYFIFEADGVTLHASEWLTDYIEVNMFNMGERLHGVEALGYRQVLLNSPLFRSESERMVPLDLGDAIAAEMVKIIVLYFNPRIGQALIIPHINAGDFVCRVDPDGQPKLKLITSRGFMTLQTSPTGEDTLNTVEFLTRLVIKRENSINHQFHRGEAEAIRFAIYPFSGRDICRGIKLALTERFGAAAAKEKAIKWITTYLAMSQMARQVRGGFAHRGDEERSRILEPEMVQFLRDEGYPVTEVSIQP